MTPRPMASVARGRRAAPADAPRSSRGGRCLRAPPGTTGRLAARALARRHRLTAAGRKAGRRHHAPFIVLKGTYEYLSTFVLRSALNDSTAEGRRQHAPLSVKTPVIGILVPLPRSSACLPRTKSKGCAYRVMSDCHFRKTVTEYDRKSGIEWLSCTGK